MGIPTFWDHLLKKQRVTRGRLGLLSMINLGFAAANLFYWSRLSRYVADPLAWSTRADVERTTGIPVLFDYPFVLLWAMPVGGVVIAAVASALEMRTLARYAVVTPLALFVVLEVWWLIFGDAFV